MNGGGSSNPKTNHLSQLPFQKIGSSRTLSSNNNKLLSGFHYTEGEDHYKKCQTNILSQLSYPISNTRGDGITHQFVGTPSFFAQEHPTPPSLRVRHTRNDSCYSNNGLLSLDDEESNVGFNTAKQQSPPPPLRATKQHINSTHFSTNTVPSTKLRRSTSLRQHQSACPPPPTLHNHNRTGNNNVINGINNNNTRINCTTHTQCNDTTDSSFAKKVSNNKHQPNVCQSFHNNSGIARNTKNVVNRNECCLSHASFKNRDSHNNNIVTSSPSENTLNVTNRDPESVSYNFKPNNSSSNSVTPLSLSSRKQRQKYSRRSTSSPSPSRTGHEATSHSSRLQKNEHNKSFVHQPNDTTTNRHNRNGDFSVNVTGAVNSINSRNEFRHGTHTRSSSASSYQKTPIKGYQQDTITSIRRSRERRSQNSPSLSRIPSFSRTPSIRRSEKTSNNKKCTTNKSGPNMGNAVGSTASLASTSSGIENGQWSYPSSNQVIQAPPESMALCYENEKTSNNHRPISMHPNLPINATNGLDHYQQPQKRQHSNFPKRELQEKHGNNHQNSTAETNNIYQRTNLPNHSANIQDNNCNTNKNNHFIPSNNGSNFQRHGSYSSFHFGTNNTLGKNVGNGLGNNSQGVISCLQGNTNQAHMGNFKPISKKNSASTFHLSNSSFSATNNPCNSTKSNKISNNFLLRSLSLRKGNNMINPSSSSAANYPDIVNDNKHSFKPFSGIGSMLFDNNRGGDYTLEEKREDELNNGGPSSLATSLPCLNNAISNGNSGVERHRTNNNYPLSSGLCQRKGSLANKKKSNSSTNSSSTSTTKSSPSSTSTTPSSSSLVLNSLPYQNLPALQQPLTVNGNNINNNNINKCKDGSKETQKIALSASSSSGLGSSGSSGTSSPNQRTSGGTSGHGTLHVLGPSSNLSLPVVQSQQSVSTNVKETVPKKRMPVTDDSEGHLAYLPGDILMERYEIGK